MSSAGITALMAVVGGIGGWHLGSGNALEAATFYLVAAVLVVALVLEARLGR